MFAVARHEFNSKLSTLKSLSPTAPLACVVDADVAANRTGAKGSPTRCLHRLVAAISFIDILLTRLASGPAPGPTLREAAAEAYDRALSPLHSYLVRGAVRAGLMTLPSREHFIHQLGETEETVRPRCREVVAASGAVVVAVSKLLDGIDVPASDGALFSIHCVLVSCLHVCVVCLLGRPSRRRRGAPALACPCKKPKLTRNHISPLPPTPLAPVRFPPNSLVLAFRLIAGSRQRLSAAAPSPLNNKALGHPPSPPPTKKPKPFHSCILPLLPLFTRKTPPLSDASSIHPSLMHTQSARSIKTNPPRGALCVRALLLIPHRISVITTPNP